MKAKRPLPAWVLVLIDCVLTGALLVTFAYFHHVRPRALEVDGTVIARVTAVPNVATQTPSVTPTPTAYVPGDLFATATPVPTPVPEDEPGSFKYKYADKFTDGNIIKTVEDGVYHYQSSSLNITITPHTYNFHYNGADRVCKYYLTDFYVKDVTCLATVFAGDSFSSGNYEWLYKVADQQNAILAVNGDFASMRQYGVVIRNGQVYRKSHSTFDACALYWDGTMETYLSKEWDAQYMIDKGAYQAWSFGPALLDENSRPYSTFNTTNAIAHENPRTAIGYFEPGHYCFVTVDGRSKHSYGVHMEGMAQIMCDLGCKCAYNLDGGRSTGLCWDGEWVNEVFNGGRKISDALILRDINGGQ